jgi:hypothetical protein
VARDQFSFQLFFVYLGVARSADINIEAVEPALCAFQAIQSREIPYCKKVLLAVNFS